jgi:uncharacterized membrane protein
MEQEKRQEMVDQIRLDLVKELGLMGYRYLITLNSGAFIVLLTFIGNVNSNAAFVLNLDHLKYAMWSFLIAICLTFFSMSIAYLSAQSNLLGRSLPGASSPFGHILWLLMPVVASFLAFVAGCAFAISGVDPR